MSDKENMKDIPDDKMDIGLINNKVKQVLWEIMPENTSFKDTEEAIKISQEGEFPQNFTFKGYDFVLHKNVFSSLYFRGSSIYVDHIPVRNDGTFLDMGCGSGVIGITVYLKYYLKKVIFGDISPYVVENVRENILPRCG